MENFQLPANHLALVPHSYKTFYFTLTEDTYKTFEIYSEMFYWEKNEFLFGDHFLRKDVSMKFSHNIVSIDEGLVNWDLTFTLYNRLKTFTLLDGHLYKYYIKRRRFKSLNKLNLVKRHFIGFFYAYPHFLYHTLYPFRTYKMNINYKKRSFFSEYAELVRPPNKKLFFNLFLRMNPFLVNIPKFISTSKYNKTMFKVSVLGFNIKFFTLEDVYLSFFRRFFGFPYRSYTNLNQKSFFLGPYVHRDMLAYRYHPLTVMLYIRNKRPVKRRIFSNRFLRLNKFKLGFRKRLFSLPRFLVFFNKGVKNLKKRFKLKFTSYIKSKSFSQIFSIPAQLFRHSNFFPLYRWTRTKCPPSSTRFQTMKKIQLTSPARFQKTRKFNYTRLAKFQKTRKFNYTRRARFQKTRTRIFNYTKFARFRKTRTKTTLMRIKRIRLTKFKHIRTSKFKGTTRTKTTLMRIKRIRLKTRPVRFQKTRKFNYTRLAKFQKTRKFKPTSARLKMKQGFYQNKEIKKKQWRW